MARKWKYLPDPVRREILRGTARGKSPAEVATEMDVCVATVRNVLRPLGGVIRSEMYSPPKNRLQLEERVEIRIGLELGRSVRSIAAELGRAPSTISREVNRNGGRAGYRPTAAHLRAHREARRPKPTKLASNDRLRERVTNDLQRLWSPEQISARLVEAFPDEPEMRVSHETIYKSLYVQGRGELRRELASCLRTGRAQRRPQGRSDTRGQIPGMIPISERPPELSDRAVPGSWEGDLIKGANNRSSIGTLVERSTRFVILLHLGDDATAENVRRKMTDAIEDLPAAIKRAITWDQGKEMSQHAQFSVETGVPVYFCDPHSPWQRGTNENTNGLLRQYFPKGTNLAKHTKSDLDRVADQLNGRPRKTLKWKTPAEALNEALVAATD